jgi:hypothetical protein
MGNALQTVTERGILPVSANFGMVVSKNQVVPVFTNVR